MSGPAGEAVKVHFKDSLSVDIEESRSKSRRVETGRRRAILRSEESRGGLDIYRVWLDFYRH